MDFQYPKSGPNLNRKWNLDWKMKEKVQSLKNKSNARLINVDQIFCSLIF
jgi:hypothetical protein